MRAQWTLLRGNGVDARLDLLAAEPPRDWPNLEMVVERTDGRFQHYWRDAAGWHAGQVVV